MNDWSEKLAQITITAWVGSLWAIGYLAAPVLFYTLQDRQLAGMLAGKMFGYVAFLGIYCAFYLLFHRLYNFGISALKQGFFWAVLVMLLLAVAGHFGIQPILAQLKTLAGATDVMQSVFADRFRAWHGIASVAYLLQSLLVLVLRDR